MFAQKFNFAVQSVSNFGKKYAVFVLAFFIGTLIIFPVLYFHFGPHFKGIELFGGDSEEAYLSQIQEMYDGHYNLGNVYLSDVKNAPYVQQPLSPFLVMMLGRFFGVSAPSINIITKFFFPCLLTWLIYVFFNNLLEKRRKGIALIMTIFVMLAPASLTFLNPAGWLHFFRNGEFVQSDLQFLSYTRAINPQLSSIFFFGYLILLLKVLNSESKKLYHWFASVILGLSFYTYFFSFSLLFALNGVLALFFLIKKDWVQFKKVLFVTVVAMLFGIPYFVNAIHVFKSPWYAQTAFRLGLRAGHSFIFSRIWWGALLATLLLYRKWDFFKIFILSFLGAAFLVTNEQLLTGSSAPVPSHYHWYYIAPLGGAILLYLVFLQLEKFISRRVLQLCFVLVAALFFWSGIQFQRQSYMVQRDGLIAEQKYGPVIHWLANNMPKDAVILGNRDVSRLVPAYTNKNVYSHTGTGDYLVDENRLIHSLFIQLSINKVTPNEMRMYLSNNFDFRTFVGAWIYSQKYRVSNGCYGCFPDSIIDPLVRRYDDFVKQNFVDELKKFPIDYIVWDKKTDPKWSVDEYFKKVVFQSGEVVVYAVN